MRSQERLPLFKLPNNLKRQTDLQTDSQILSIAIIAYQILAIFEIVTGACFHNYTNCNISVPSITNILITSGTTITLAAILSIYVQKYKKNSIIWQSTIKISVIFLAILQILFVFGCGYIFFFECITISPVELCIMIWISLFCKITTILGLALHQIFALFAK